VIFFALSSIVWAECESPMTSTDWMDLIYTSRSSFTEMDQDGFQASRQEAVLQLSCVSGIIDATQVAHLHQLQALNAFLLRDFTQMGGFVEAAYNTDPDLLFPIEAFPLTHPIRHYITYSNAQLPASKLPLPFPEVGTFQVDGAVVTTMPSDRPYFFQHISGEGTILSTQYLSSGEIPAYPVKGAGRILALKVDGVYAAGAGSAAVLSMGLGYWATQSEQRFWHPSTPDIELESIRNQTNTLSGAAIGLAISSIGLWGVALFGGS